MKKSLKKLLIFLIEAEGYVTISDVCNKFSWSKRMTDSNLEKLNEELIIRDLGEIYRQPGKGIIIHHVETKMIEEYFLKDEKNLLELELFTSEERQLYILWGIMCTPKSIKINYLMKELDVSRSTINNDLKLLKTTLTTEDIILEFTKDKGFYLVGNEFRLRLVVLKFLLLKTEGEFEYYDCSEKIEFLNDRYQEYNVYKKNSSSFDKINRILPNNLSYDSKRLLMFYIEVAVCRNKFTNGIMDKLEDKIIMDSPFYELSKLIILELAKDCNILHLDFESYLLSLMIITLPSDKGLTFHSRNPIELELLSFKIIETVSRIQSYPFYEDNELHNIIVSHLSPVIHRMKYNIQIKNPILSMIENKYNELNKTVKIALNIVEDYINTSLTNDEISFFTLYFASSREKLGTRNSIKKNVVIVCNSGNAVSRLIQYKLLNYFDISVVSVLPEDRLIEFINRQEVDIVITITRLKEKIINPKPIVHISPLLTDKDLIKLKKVLPEKRAGLQIKYGKEDSKNYSLLDLLTEDRFRIDTEAESIDEFVKLSGSLLEESGCVNSNYTKEMLDIIKEYKTLRHINISPGVILPHAKISDSVYKPGISFIRNKKQLFYKNERIDCSFAMCTTNRDIHSKAIKELGILLNKKQFKDRLRKVGNYSEFKCLVNELL